jgi:ferredoxin-NADP reductase
MTDLQLSQRTSTEPGSAAELELVGKRTIAAGVVELLLAAPDRRRLRDWTPGSHVDLALPNGLVRQYSLCGVRRDPYTYRVAVLQERQSRGGSDYVHRELGVGDLVTVRGPRNNFPLSPAPSYLFVAGGIGITPILAMVAQASELGVPWRLLYGGRNRTSMAYLDELEQYGDNVQVVPQDEAGLPDLTGFLAEDSADALVYACGPSGLLRGIEAACQARPAHTLRTERFVAELDPPVRTTAFTVRLEHSGADVIVPPDLSVLDAVAQAGVEVLSSCRQGVCGTCETTVLAGTPDHRDSVLATDERAAGDCMLICVSRSCSDLLVLDL